MANCFAEKYNYIINDLADPRVKDWMLISSPVITLFVIAVYLASIYIFFPAYMKNRKPYELKTLLLFYNIFQIVYCLKMIHGMISSGLTWTCQPVDYSTNQHATTLLNCFYYAYVLKGIELFETVFFILRKKYNQVSKLHVYHHTSTFFLAWIGTKYVGGGMAAFPLALNCSVHVLMYTYYFLSSLGEEWQKKINEWKATMTTIQMVQFVIIIFHALQALHPECKVQKQLLVIYLPNVALVFYMFWQFYQENYTKKKTE